MLICVLHVVVFNVKLFLTLKNQYTVQVAVSKYNYVTPLIPLELVKYTDNYVFKNCVTFSSMIQWTRACCSIDRGTSKIHKRPVKVQRVLCKSLTFISDKVHDRADYLECKSSKNYLSIAFQLTRSLNSGNGRKCKNGRNSMIIVAKPLIRSNDTTDVTCKKSSVVVFKWNNMFCKNY